MSGGREMASELWDDTYDQGERYYRQGSRAVGNLDGATLVGLLPQACLAAQSHG